MLDQVENAVVEVWNQLPGSQVSGIEFTCPDLCPVILDVFAFFPFSILLLLRCLNI